MKPSTSSITYAGNRTIKRPLGCPYCRRELRAQDVIADEASGRAVLICSRCHRDILAIEWCLKS